MLGQLVRLILIDRSREIRSDCCVGSRTDRAEGGEMNGAVEEAEKPPSRRLALVAIEFEHRLHIVRRTGDHLQYLGSRRLLLAGFLQVFARTGDRTTFSSGGR